MKRKILITLGVIFAIFIITNPTPSSFYYYAGAKHYVRREANFFVCSIYKNKGNVYLGVLGNFIKISYK